MPTSNSSLLTKPLAAPDYVLQRGRKRPCQQQTLKNRDSLSAMCRSSGWHKGGPRQGDHGRHAGEG